MSSFAPQQSDGDTEPVATDDMEPIEGDMVNDDPAPMAEGMDGGEDTGDFPDGEDALMEAMDDDGMGDMDMDDGGTDMEDDGTDTEDGMMDMEMGERCLTPASAAGGTLKGASFELLDVRPREGYEGAAGRAEMAVADNGTTVTIKFVGLEPNTEFISHVHADTCANNGGDHFQFEIGGSVMPPNEIHLNFTSDAEGNGYMTAFNHGIVDDGAKSVVVHPMGLLDNKIACAEF